MSVVSASPEPPVTIVQPARRLVPLDLRELWGHRDLLFFLVRRQLRVRFAQTKAGGVWLVLQPLLQLAVYAFVFSRIAKSNITVPYPLFALAGLTAWLFISRTLTTGAGSLVSNSNVVKKVACPRILFPIATVIAGTVDYIVTLALYFVLGAAYGRAPRWEAIFVVPLWLLAFSLTLGLVLLLAPLQARYRDVTTLLPFMVQIWFFVSPVAYTLPKLGPKGEVVAKINPLTGIVNGFRWSLTGAQLEPGKLLIAIGIAGGALLAGLYRFNVAQQNVADDL